MAIDDLCDKTKIMRRFRPDAVSVASCKVTNFKTRRFGLKKRPDFRVLRWITLDGDGSKPLPAPEVKTITAAPVIAPAATPAATAPAVAPTPMIMKPVTLGKPVAPSTLAQETDDQVPF
jgi:hypothetical protein